MIWLIMWFGHVTDEEYNVLMEGTDKAVLATKEYIENGIDCAMNKFNWFLT